MIFFRYFLILSVVFFIPSPVRSEVYQYFDEEGTLVVTDNPFGIRKQRPHPATTPKDLKLVYREDVLYDYYTVYGDTFHEAVRSTKNYGPRDPQDRKRYAAETEWRLGWSYKYESSYRMNGNFLSVILNIYDIEFRSDITILLPMLSEHSRMDDHDLQLWKDFLQGLLKHEHDHVKIIKDPFYWDAALRDISSIKNITIPIDQHQDFQGAIKRAVESRTAKIGRNLIRHIREENEEYDRLTEHGLKPEMREGFFGR